MDTMKNILLIASALLFASAQADMTATTDKGKKVLLKDNGTWQYIKEGEEAAQGPSARLVLENMQEIPNGCRFGLRMHNDLNEQVRTLVLRFTAYKEGNIPFETVSRGYSFIKPTNNQYQQIRFRDLSCAQIDKIQVRAAHNCHVGSLTKYSATEDDCLALVTLEDSDIKPLFSPPRESKDQKKK